MIPRPAIGRVHVITDVSIQTRFSHTDLARAALTGGADVIQLRDKRLDDEALGHLAREIAAMCRSAGAALLVNDRPHVAHAAGANGVHLGRDDLPVADARNMLGAGAIIGATASTLDEALESDASGADYIGFGHVYTTATKEKTGPAVGLEGVRAVCAVVSVPVIAIGGIDAERAARCIAAGAHGVAVVSAVCAAADPVRATRAIVRAVQGEIG